MTSFFLFISRLGISFNSGVQKIGSIVNPNNYPAKENVFTILVVALPSHHFLGLYSKEISSSLLWCCSLLMDWGGFLCYLDGYSRIWKLGRDGTCRKEMALSNPGFIFLRNISVFLCKNCAKIRYALETALHAFLGGISYSCSSCLNSVWLFRWRRWIGETSLDLCFYRILHSWRSLNTIETVGAEGNLFRKQTN